MKVAFVGGAADDTFGTKVVKSAYLQFVSHHSGEQAEYFEWVEWNRLKYWILSERDSVTLLSHSYGASTAARLVATGVDVEQLITVDPVGWRRPDYQLITDHCGSWLNLNAIGFEGSWKSFQNNAVAAIGGAWRDRPADYAHHHLNVPDSDHVTVFSRYWWPCLTGELDKITRLNGMSEK